MTNTIKAKRPAQAEILALDDLWDAIRTMRDSEKFSADSRLMSTLELAFSRAAGRAFDRDADGGSARLIQLWDYLDAHPLGSIVDAIDVLYCPAG
jgi:hypothetical protein